MKKTFKNSKGITLVALVITIIILLILAGISISALTNTGIFQKAKDAKQKSEDAALDQNTKLDEYENELDKYLPKQNENSLAKAVKVGNYVAYTPDEPDNNALTTLKTNFTTYSGKSSSAINSAIDRDNLSWRVLDVDETTGAVRLISATPTDKKIELYGYNGYNNAVKLLDDACSTLYNSKLATKVQNLKIEDIQDHLTYDYTQYRTSDTDLKYGETKEYTTNKNYPYIFKNEKTGWVDGVQGTEYDFSGQVEPMNETSSIANDKIKITQTFWTKLMSSEDFDNNYYELFIKKESQNYPIYWLSSRYMCSFYDFASYGINCVNINEVYGFGLINSDGGEAPVEASFRPVITLNPDAKLSIEN